MEEIDERRCIISWPGVFGMYSTWIQTVRRHIDQTIRGRARNEIVERGTATKSQKGRKASVERKVGECYQWNAIGQCSKGDSCNFSDDRASGNRCDQRQKGQSSSFCTKSADTDRRRETQKVQALGEKVLVEQEADLGGDISQGESVRIRRVFCGTLRVSITSLNRDAIWRQMSTLTRWGWWAAQ